MYQTVKMTCALLNLLAHVVVNFHVEDIGYQVERILVVLDFSVEASKVEPISEVIFVDFAEVLVAAG